MLWKFRYRPNGSNPGYQRIIFGILLVWRRMLNRYQPSMALHVVPREWVFDDDCRSSSHWAVSVFRYLTGNDIDVRPATWPLPSISESVLWSYVRLMSHHSCPKELLLLSHPEAQSTVESPSPATCFLPAAARVTTGRVSNPSRTVNRREDRQPSAVEAQYLTGMKRRPLSAASSSYLSFMLRLPSFTSSSCGSL